MELEEDEEEDERESAVGAGKFKTQQRRGTGIPFQFRPNTIESLALSIYCVAVLRLN